jgi:hypothetical protein
MLRSQGNCENNQVVRLLFVMHTMWGLVLVVHALWMDTTYPNGIILLLSSIRWTCPNLVIISVFQSRYPVDDILLHMRDLNVQRFSSLTWNDQFYGGASDPNSRFWRLIMLSTIQLRSLLFILRYQHLGSGYHCVSCDGV